MKKNYLEIKIQDKIAWIKINREEKLNALNISMLEEIRKNLIDLGKNKNVLVLVIIGSGDKAFVAGADIAEFSKYDKNKGLELAKKGQKNVLDLIENFPKEVENGDKALIKYTKKFDGFYPKPMQVSTRDLKNAWDETDQNLKQSLEKNANNLHTYLNLGTAYYELKDYQNFSKSRELFLYKSLLSLEK